MSKGLLGILHWMRENSSLNVSINKKIIYFKMELNYNISYTQHSRVK